MKNLIEKYNNEKTIMVISSYPDKKNGIKNLNAVAWYAQKLIHEVGNRKKFVVLAEIIDKPEVFEDGSLLVVRCWRRNSPFSVKDILLTALKFNKVKSVLVEFEFSSFGGLITTALFPLLLFGLRILGKRVILELHQVVLDINCLSGHTNLRKNGFLSTFFNLALKIFFTAISLLANRIIVLEEELKNRLSRFVSRSKITTLFIAISEKESISKEEARKILDLNPKDFIILNFGFINWYKGSDWIVKAVKGQKVKLIVAGGQSPTLREKTHYQNFYKKIVSTSETMPNVQVTGFLKDDEIPAYFAACDLVVLPYRAMMSSSGPLSLALSYQKPFILSSHLSGYFASADFRKAARLAQLTKEDLFFDLNYHIFKDKLKSLKITKLAKFSSNLSRMRSEKKLSRVYLKELTYVPNSNNRRRFLSGLGKLFPRKLVVRVGQSAPRVLFGSQH